MIIRKLLLIPIIAFGIAGNIAFLMKRNIEATLYFILIGVIYLCLILTKEEKKGRGK